MSGKDKLRKFRENETFNCLYQPSTEEVLNKDYPLKGKWGAEVFGNNNPIILELGCGKGEYTLSLAQMFPHKNFIGIDIKGARLWKGAKYAQQENLSNVAFIRTRIEFIESLFGTAEISEIWITFADPQLNRTRKRLTGTMFLNRYKNFLTPGGIINLKTDSQFLHQYTLACTKSNNLTILEADNNIYGSGRADTILSIRTFYEAHYIKKGLAITYMAFKIDNSAPLQEPQWNEDYWLAEEMKGREDILVNKG
ncbi:MAG: tRNA (guanosine(46)-N7)-methyltransferase TrmB [Bacteroidales bacterium]